MQWYLSVLSNYANFSGRARRSEYWYFVLFNFLVGILAYIVGAIFKQGPLLNGLYSLAVFLPSLAVLVRRLHDTGRSGWWWFIVFIPLLGALVLIIYTAEAGSIGPNKYGPDPKAAEAVPAPA